MSSNLYKIFTSEAIKLSQKNEFLTLIAFRFTLSWRYIIVVSFISIASVIIKLKFQSFAYRFSIHETSLFGRFLGPYSPKMVQYCRHSLANKNTVWKKIFRVQLFMEKGRTQSSTFGPTSTPLFLLKMAKIEKKSAVVRKNFSHWAIQICQSEVFISSSFSRKNTITFCNIWDIFTRKQDGVTSQRSRIKILQMIFHPHDSWSSSCKKNLVQIFSSFAALDHKGRFRKILTRIFKFGWFSWYHTYIV